MDLAKFLSLLDKSALFFVRADKLNSIEPFEGHYTNANMIALDDESYINEILGPLAIPDESIRQNLARNFRLIPKIVKSEFSITFINSWHAQDHESAAMWSIYAKSSEGIAIKSSYDRLIRALANYDDFDIFVGMVNYIDYDKDLIPIGNLLSPFIHKGKSFDFERELRALIRTPPRVKDSAKDPDKKRSLNESGMYVPIELSDLIDNVYLSPTAPRWMFDLLVSIIDKYELKKEVIQSDLSSKPVY